jgi:hypothetical protein
MLVEKYSSASDSTAEFTGSKSVGLCGVGTKTCYDVALLAHPDDERQASKEESIQLFLELPPEHADYNSELQKLARDMNKYFRERAKGLLPRFIKTVPKARPGVHMAAIGSRDGLYLAYATRVSSEELIRTGAKVATDKLRSVMDTLMSPPKSTKGTRATEK